MGGLSGRDRNPQNGVVGLLSPQLGRNKEVHVRGPLAQTHRTSWGRGRTIAAWAGLGLEVVPAGGGGGFSTLRNSIERFFNRANNSRRPATRYDKLIESFAPFVPQSPADASRFCTTRRGPPDFPISQGWFGYPSIAGIPIQPRGRRDVP